MAIVPTDIPLCHADRPRASPQPKLPFEKFWKCLELTWLYEPYFLSVRRYVFDSDSHRSEPPCQCTS